MNPRTAGGLTASALVLAAGSGRRMAEVSKGTNKVLLELGGVPLFFHSLSRILDSPCIDAVVLVVRGDDREWVEDFLRTRGLLDRLHQVVTGGKERFDSVYRGLLALRARSPERVLIHDSARPFPTERMIGESIQSAEKHGGATVAVPLSDTLKREDEGLLVETLPRKGLWRIQTPQTFRFAPLLEAHERFQKDPDPEVTDDCMLLERAGGRIGIVMGSEDNLKVTTPFDLRLAEFLFSGQLKE